MRLTQKLLVLLITISMLLSGSYVQTFAAEEAVDGSVVVSEEASEKTTDEAEAVNEDAPAAPDNETGEAAPKKEPETESEAKSEVKEVKTEEKAEEVSADANDGSIVYECDDYTVVLEYGKDAGIPTGTTLDVREIIAESKDKKEKEEYEKYHDETLDALRKERAEDKSVSEDIASLGFARFFDITLISDGKEIEPSGDVNVMITFNKDAREAVSKTEDAENNLRVVHITENEKNGELEAAALDKKDTEMSLDKKELSETSFTTDSFSVYGIVYTVDFEYEGYTFSIEGESDILISELFERLHIKEDASKVENVEFTDYELIKVEQTEGDWKLTSLKPFDTEEKLTITLPEKVIEIKVTDAQNNNTFLLYRVRYANEYFKTRLYISKPSGSRTQAGTSETTVIHDGSEGWMDIETFVKKYSNEYAFPRYSVISASDQGDGNYPLCAAGFFSTSVLHGTGGLYPETRTVGWFSYDGAASDTTFDIDITLNDNSLPVKVYVDDVLEYDDAFIDANDLGDSEKEYTVTELLTKLGYSGYVVDSSKIGSTETGAVSVKPMTDQPLAGKSISRPAVPIVAPPTYYTNAFSYTYKNAYQWTYNNGTAVGDNTYEIRLVSPIARVKSGNGDWTYHSQLINGGTQGDGTTKIGAFDQANSLTGDVVVEMLYDTHERYTLGSGFTFNNTDIDSLTIKGTGNKSTLVKNQTTATIVPMITTTGIDKVELNKMIFDGNDQITTNAHGGAVNTNAAELLINSCEFKNCQAGYQGGGINHNNINGTVVIDDSTFTSCRANGPKDEVGAGGGGVYTNAQTLTVTDCTFDRCTTKVRQGAGLFHQRAKTDPADSEASFKDCTFKDCEAKWSGGGIESDAWTVTLDTVEFTNCKATKGGAINVWADGQDSTSNDTTFNITNCTFKDCTGTDNGGAVRSTSLSTNITESSFEGCSSNANGGALACTNNKTNTIITDCTIKDCSANGNGGAVSSAGTVLFKETQTDKTTISGCSAKKGGAIYSSKIVMTGGSVIGNTTNDTDSAAVDATTGASGITLSGNVKVKENNGSGGVYHNVYIGMDSDRHILIDRNGLGPEASVGVYVADANSAFAKHGKPNQLFAHTGDVQASTVSNLDKLFSDRLDNGPMHGKAATIGANYTLRVMWAAPICKIVDGNGEHPFETLRDALAFARGSEITTPMSASNPVKIEMLIDYVIPKSDNLTLNQATDNIIITTAATSGGTYNFRPLFTEEQGRLPEDSESIAILQRGWPQANNAEALFYINNASASFTTGNIIIDGQSKNAGESALLQKNGRAVYINNGSLSANGNTTFRNNKMTYNNTDGGAVYAANNLTYTVSDTGNVLFDNCSATRNGGAIYANKALTITNNNGGTLRFNACKANGTDPNGKGGGIYGNGELTITSTGTDKTVFTSCTANYGGGIYQNGTGDLTLTNVTFGKAGDEDKGCFAEVEGGSVCAKGTNTTITDCDFYYSQAGSGLNDNNTHGGAVCYGGSGEHKILGCVFDNCSVKTTSTTKSHGNGGGVFVNESGTSLIIDESDTRHSTFTNCSAYRYGGAVIMEKDGDCTCSISNSDFEECWTTFRDGGAVYSDSNSTSFDGCTFKNCHSDSNSDGGGAIFMNGDTPKLSSTITITDCQFDGCYANKNGGAIHFYSTGTNATLDNVQITGANAALGSGVYSKGNVTIKDSEITGCSASANDGGAVNVYSDKTVYFEGDTVIRNNTNTSHDTGNEHNVILDQNRNLEIQTTSAGIGANADIGIYVTGTRTTNPFKDHGSFKDDFGTYASGGSTANFDRFINDREVDANGDKLRGELCPEPGHTDQRLIRWIGAEPVAPTGYNRNYIPFILILIVGTALAMLKKAADRRKSSEKDFETEE